jgi:hypothetical protein
VQKSDFSGNSHRIGQKAVPRKLVLARYRPNDCYGSHFLNVKVWFYLDGERPSVAFAIAGKLNGPIANFPLLGDLGTFDAHDLPRLQQ